MDPLRACRNNNAEEVEVEVDDALNSWQDDPLRRGPSEWSLTLDEAAKERKTQRTYRYGIALVCLGATLNWLGFAQGHGYVDPVRYVGVACVISGSLCVCLAMCRWLGRPINVSSTPRLHPFRDDGTGSSRQYGDVHVINVSVPIYTPSLCRSPTLNKPPDYDTLMPPPHSQPPAYEEAIKLSLFPHNGKGEESKARTPITPPTCPSQQCTSTSTFSVGVGTRTPPPPYHTRKQPIPSVHSQNH